MSYQYMKPILKIRRTSARLICNMEIPIHWKDGFYSIFTRLHLFVCPLCSAVWYSLVQCKICKYLTHKTGVKRTETNMHIKKHMNSKCIKYGTE